MRKPVAHKVRFLCSIGLVVVERRGVQLRDQSPVLRPRDDGFCSTFRGAARKNEHRHCVRFGRIQPHLYAASQGAPIQFVFLWRVIPAKVVFEALTFFDNHHRDVERFLALQSGQTVVHRHVELGPRLEVGVLKWTVTVRSSGEKSLPANQSSRRHKSYNRDGELLFRRSGDVVHRSFGQEIKPRRFAGFAARVHTRRRIAWPNLPTKTPEPSPRAAVSRCVLACRTTSKPPSRCNNKAPRN